MYDIFSLKDFKFPEGFLWGSATAAHQIEGDNIHSGHWKREQNYHTWGKSWCVPSGKACDHYNRVEQDVNMIADLGHRGYRMGIEWARIEPEEGHFEQKEVDHYIRELSLLKEKGIQTNVTLIHFSIPQWLEERSGLANAENIKYFERYLKFLLPQITQYVDFWGIINEFNLGIKPEMIAKKAATLKFHAMAYRLIKTYSNAPISSPHAAVMMDPKRRYDKFDSTLADYKDWAENEFFFHAVRTGEIVLPFYESEYVPELKGALDYWSVNIYTREMVDSRTAKGTSDRYDHKYLKLIPRQPFYLDEFFPENMIHMLTRLGDKPVYITENGVSAYDDRWRIVFITLYLNALHEAIRMGVDVRGYLYWSLMDNYEWVSFIPRFGIVGVDYKTFERTPKPSAYFFRDIIENNGFTQDILKKYLTELPKIDPNIDDLFPENGLY